MLSQRELRELLATPGTVLALDTNVLRQMRRLFDLADRVNQLNKSHSRAIQLVIPAPAHGERLFQLRRQHGAGFSANKVQDFFEQKGIAVPPFDLQAAEGVADVLAGLFPDDAAWGHAKVKGALRRLGLPEDASSKEQFPGTIDWLISGQALVNQWVLVTDDTGDEFSSLQRRATLELAEKALAAELSAPPL